MKLVVEAGAALFALILAGYVVRVAPACSAPRRPQTALNCLVWAGVAGRCCSRRWPSTLGRAESPGVVAAISLGNARRRSCVGGAGAPARQDACGREASRRLAGSYYPYTGFMGDPAVPLAVFGAPPDSRRFVADESCVCFALACR